MNVHWHEGLFLQPHHLQLMQRELQMETRAARTWLSPYLHGILDVRLSQDDLADGRIRFERLHVIMPSGLEVKYPEAASLPSFDVRAALAQGVGKVDILLGVPLWAKNRANAFRIGDPPDTRIKLLYLPEETQGLADENTGENPQVVFLRRINARVLLRSDDASDLETLPLLRIIRDVGAAAGQPRQDPDFVAPAILLRSSSFLHDLIRNLTAQLNASREQLRVKVAGGGHGMEVRWELSLKLLVLNRFCSSLPGLVEEGLVHPHSIYLMLRECLGELLALNPGNAQFNCLPYEHLDPLPAFVELDRKIRAEIRVARAAEPLKVVFTGAPGMRRAALEAQHLERPTGYYLGVKTRADRSKLAAYVVDANKFKLMPRSMETVAIFGVELKEENFPPLELPGESDLHYFRLVPLTNPRRWEQVKTDKALSLVWNNAEFDLSDAVFTLYMPLPASSAT